MGQRTHEASRAQVPALLVHIAEGNHTAVHTEEHPKIRESASVPVCQHRQSPVPTSFSVSSHSLTRPYPGSISTSVPTFQNVLILPL